PQAEDPPPADGQLADGSVEAQPHRLTAANEQPARGQMGDRRRQLEVETLLAAGEPAHPPGPPEDDLHGEPLPGWDAHGRPNAAITVKRDRHGTTALGLRPDADARCAERRPVDAYERLGVERRSAPRPGEDGVGERRRDREQTAG